MFEIFSSRRARTYALEHNLFPLAELGFMMRRN